MNWGTGVCPMNWGLFVLPSGIFLGISSLVFSKTQHVARGLCVVVRDRAGFFEKMGQRWAKIGFFGFIGKFSHFFFLNLVYKESSYCLLYSCTNPILGKNLFPEIWPKYSWLIKLQDFAIDYISRTQRWKSLIFCMLILINGN